MRINYCEDAEQWKEEEELMLNNCQSDAKLPMQTIPEKRGDAN